MRQGTLLELAAASLARCLLAEEAGQASEGFTGGRFQKQLKCTRSQSGIKAGPASTLLSPRPAALPGHPSPKSPAFRLGLQPCGDMR